MNGITFSGFRLLHLRWDAHPISPSLHAGDSLNIFRYLGCLTLMWVRLNPLYPGLSQEHCLRSGTREVKHPILFVPGEILPKD